MLSCPKDIYNSGLLSWVEFGLVLFLWLFWAVEVGVTKRPVIGPENSRRGRRERNKDDECAARKLLLK